MDGLVWSDDLIHEAERVRTDVSATLAGLGVVGEVELTGALSVPGALTKGDVDLHVRVEPAGFDDVVERLRRAFPVASHEAWAPTLAVFEVPGPLPTGLAVTPLGSEHDSRFRLTWQRLRHEPSLLAEYNSLKSGGVGSAGYEERKARFFSAIARTQPD